MDGQMAAMLRRRASRTSAFASFTEAPATNCKHGARVCRVGVKISSIYRIDEVGGAFHADFVVVSSWTEPKLRGHRPAGTIVWNELFSPRLYVTNAQLIETKYKKQTLVDANQGIVEQHQHFRGMLSMRILDIHSFPFDFQDFPICVQSRSHSTKLLEIKAWPEMGTMGHHPENEWRVAGLRQELYATHPKFHHTDKAFHELHTIIMAARHPSWYVRNIIVVNFMLALLSFSVFWMPFKSNGALGVRTSTLTATVIACMTTKFTVSQYLPKVHYETLLERYINQCFILLVYAMAESMVVFWVEHLACGPMSSGEERNVGGIPWAGEHGTVEAFQLNAIGTVLYFLGLVAISLNIYVQTKTAVGLRTQWEDMRLPNSSLGRKSTKTLLSTNGEETVLRKIYRRLKSVGGGEPGEAKESVPTGRINFMKVTSQAVHCANNPKSMRGAFKQSLAKGREAKVPTAFEQTEDYAIVEVGGGGP